MEICVFGAGSIGCYVGGRLAATGSRVTFIGRPRLAAEIRQHGLHLTDWLGADLRVPPDDVRFDTIWSNPPIRVGKAVLHELLLTWLPRLTDDGEAYLVVQRNLGADSLQAWLAAELPRVTGQAWRVERTGSAKGYRVLGLGRS